jgi:hypothetical protein
MLDVGFLMRVQSAKEVVWKPSDQGLSSTTAIAMV